MKKAHLIILLFFFVNTLNTYTSQTKNIKEKRKADNISFSVFTPSKQHKKIKCQAIIQTDKKNNQLLYLANLIKYDLEFSDQLDINLKLSKNQLDKKSEVKLFKNGTSLCLYFKKKGNKKINIELKDLGSNYNILQKDFEFNPKNIVFSAHKISSKIIPLLTGDEGICLNALAYCKMLSPTHKIICISDYAGKKEKSVVTTKTVNIAPSWHTKADILYFSQFLANKIRLKSINLNTQKSSIVCSYDGLNMQPSFSPDGTKAAMCLSGGKNSEIYLYDHKVCSQLKKRAFIKLTNNKGNNVSPSLLHNNDLIFCSDFEKGLPQIYYLDKANNKTHRLTNGRGYCAAPSYCAKNNSIVYTRLLRGTFQLFSLNVDNFDNLEEKQITFNTGNKHEPDISGCGRFVAFSYDCSYKKGFFTQQIAVLNMQSGKIRILTNGKESKNFPKWSKKHFYF